MKTLKTVAQETEMRQSKRPGIRSGEVVSIQYLRGLAASVVIYYHIFSNRVAEHYSLGREFGLIGVDIFFVLSGFIMWITTIRSKIGAADFIQRRVLRIYPAYWVALTLWIAIRLVVPDRLLNADVTPLSTVLSYLLIPHWHTVFSEHAWPILIPGWTLQLELVFYGVFSISLLFPTPPKRLFVITFLLAGLVLAGLWKPLSSAIWATYTSPLLIEFFAGVALGLVAERLRTAGLYTSIALLIVFAAYFTISLQNISEVGLTRVLTLGLPAILLVAASLALEPYLLRWPSRTMLLLGDCSYSLYLSHPISISAMAVIWTRLDLPVGSNPKALLFVPVAFVSALLGGFGFYWLIERPALRLLMLIRSSTTGPSSSHRDKGKLVSR